MTRATRPEQDSERALVLDAHRDGYSLTPATHIEELRKIVDGGYVVIVRTTGGLPTRRVYLSLTGAERAVKRAEARGQNAVLVLAELKALYRITAPDRHDGDTA